jgi:hypothetical protein
MVRAYVCVCVCVCVCACVRAALALFSPTASNISNDFGPYDG